MRTPRAFALTACVAALTACAPGASTESAGEPAGIAQVAQLKATFGDEFQVTTVGPTGIDPERLSPQAVPAGMTFEPADCAKFATGLAVPPGAQGNMAATTAEGDGNRFIVIAVETSEPIPFNDPGPGCQKVGYGGPGMRGLVEVVESPQIDGVRTLGTHRVVQTFVDEKPHSGELFNYVASFENFLVIVTANPLVLPDKPVAPVDTQRARALLTEAVSAVRG